MPDKITFDPSQPIEIYFRVNRAGIAKKLVFNNADGTPFDISSYAFEFFAKQTEQSTDKVFSLTVANGGLSVTGDDTNELNIILTSTHSNVRARQYYGELYESTQKITWLNADVIAHKGKFDGISETDGITIQLDGNDVNITVAAGGGGLSTVSVDNVTIQGDGSSGSPLAVKSGVFDASGAAAGVQTNLTNHENNTSNPHSVTKTQVGLGNVDNTNDANKPVSTAQANADALVASNAATDATNKANAAQSAAQTYADLKLAKASNLSDLASAATARTNLGVSAALITTNRQTASYTLVIGDADLLVEMNVASANNLTVPPNSSVAFSVGTQILIAQYGAGQTTVVAGSGVTIRSASGNLKLTGQYSGATLIKISTNEWYLFGDLTA